MRFWHILTIRKHNFFETNVQVSIRLLQIPRQSGREFCHIHFKEKKSGHESIISDLFKKEKIG